MGRIIWDAAGEKRYEMGVDRGVLYQDLGGSFGNGVAWNGLTGVDNDDDGHEVTPMYSGDVKSESLSTYSEFSGTIDAYTYPDEFESCIGSTEVVNGIFMQQQSRSRFGVSYRTLTGNDTEGQEYGYKIHLIYDAEVIGNSMSRTSLTDSPEPVEMSWEISTIPQVSDNYDPYSELIIDSTKFSAEFMEQLEDILYGTDEEAPRLPSLEELIELFTVEEPIPEDWKGFPHDRLYPSEEVYPFRPPTKTIDFLYSTNVVYPGQAIPYLATLPSGDPFVPVGSTGIECEVINLPTKYSMLDWTARLSADNTQMTIIARNNTSEPVEIKELGAFPWPTLRIQVSYIPLSTKNTNFSYAYGSPIEPGQSGISMLAQMDPFIPADSTDIQCEVTNIPSEYSMLDWSASLSSDKTQITVTATNNTSEAVEIDSSVSLKVTIHYKINTKSTTIYNLTYRTDTIYPGQSIPCILTQENPFISPTTTLIKCKVLDIPSEYQALDWSAQLDIERTQLTVTATNNTSDPVQIETWPELTVEIQYFPQEEEENNA